ncbi:transposase [Companilactobacillus sp. HBUAS59544]|uniref:transposase n=1 Tax=Companilactobacillus sp. HBUAS59544 TaxID=3109363 RepID=UPI002FF1C788
MANASKYTFVWRKSVEKAEPKLDEKTDALYDEVIQSNVNIEVSKETSRSLNSTELDEVIKTEKVTVGGSKNKRLRRKLKHYNHLLKNDLIPRKKKYEDANEIFGDRNSFSKTDHDATFMRMKNGQLKSGYNLQVASQNQFALYYYVFQRPNDTRTLILFLTDIFEETSHVADYVVADAGYGSEMNYQFITDELEANYLIPYRMYEKEMTRSYHKDKRKVANWNYDEFNDTFTDLDGIEFKFLRYSVRHDKYGDERNFKVYQSVEYFEDPTRENLATTKKGYRRQININANWEYFKNKAKEQLSSEVGQSIYAQRKIDVEPIFADLKAHLSFNRLSVRGLENAKIEIGLALMSNNLAKLARLLSYPTECQKNTIGIPYFMEISIVFFWNLELCPELFYILY